MNKLPSLRPNHPPEEPNANETTRPTRPNIAIPRLLDDHYNGRIDLLAELNTRYHTLALLSVCRTVKSKTQAQVGTAYLSTADGSAGVVAEADSTSLQLIFTYASMLGLRFHLDDLTAKEFSHWIERINQKDNSVIFLWGARRWERDYLVCVNKRGFVNLYAFSAHGFEAAVRLTPETLEKWFGLLSQIWKVEEPPPPPSNATSNW